MDTLDKENLKAAVDYIDIWLNINFDNSRIPAMQIAMQHGEGLIYSRAFGYADVAGKKKLTTSNVFRIASHSKTFTATAIMQLVESAKLNLDDKVAQHIGWFKSSKDARVGKVTVRQLLNHTAGVIRDGDNSDFWQLLRKFPDKAELKKYVATSKLVYDSDEKFKYSNFGYGYLGLVIEAASGVHYKEYVTKNIIERMGLKSTGADLDAKAKELLTKGYGIELFHKSRRVFDHVETRDLAAATGFYSNAEEVCRYFSGHFLGNDKLISDASKRQMQHGYWKPEGSRERYGLGMVNYKRKGWNIYGHSGGLPGFITSTQFDAKKQLVITVLTNAYDSQATNICSKLLSIIGTFQQDTDNSKLKTSSLKKFEGRYYSTWGPTDIVLVGKKLIAIESLGWTAFDDGEELSVVDENTLRIDKASGYSSPGEIVRYKFDSNGKATEINYAGRTMLVWEKTQLKGWF